LSSNYDIDRSQEIKSTLRMVARKIFNDDGTPVIPRQRLGNLLENHHVFFGYGIQ